MSFFFLNNTASDLVSFGLKSHLKHQSRRVRINLSFTGEQNFIVLDVRYLGAVSSAYWLVKKVLVKVSRNKRCGK